MPGALLGRLAVGAGVDAEADVADGAVDAEAAALAGLVVAAAPPQAASMSVAAMAIAVRRQVESVIGFPTVKGADV